MIALLGSHGYIGSAFADELTRQGIPWTPVPFPCWEEYIQSWHELDLIINCAAFIPKTSVNECSLFPEETIRSNLILPSRLASMADKLAIPIAHLSTGYLWNDGIEHSEEDPPQRMFNGYCGFYIGTKVLSEEEVRRVKRHYIWRLSLAFDELDNERNYLTKLANFPDVYDRDNCVSHRLDFVISCLDLWKRRAPYGTYNVMNHGSIKATQIVKMLMDSGIRKTKPNIITGGHGDSKASVAKLLAMGIKIRSSGEAIAESIIHWKQSHV